MITKQDIIKMAKHVGRRSAGSADRQIIHPARDWALILFLGVVVFLAGIAFNSWSYLRYTSIEERLLTGESSVVRYDAAAVERALEQYREAQTAFDALFVATPVIAPTSTATTTEEALGEESTAEEAEETDIPAEDEVEEGGETDVPLMAV